MGINKIQICNLHGGDCICLVSIIYSKEDLEKLGLKSDDDIDEYIKSKFIEEKA